MLTAKLTIDLLSTLVLAPVSCGAPDLTATQGFSQDIDATLAPCDVLGTHGELWLTEHGAVYSVELDDTLNTWDLIKDNLRNDYPQLAADSTPQDTITFDFAFRSSSDVLKVWTRDGGKWLLVETLVPGEDHMATLELDIDAPYWLDPIPGPEASEPWDYPFGETTPSTFPPSGRAAVLKPVLTCPN